VTEGGALWVEDRVTFQAGDALHLPFDDGTFDAVFLQHVAMAIEDRSALYAEVRRVLMGGGRFVVKEQQTYMLERFSAQAPRYLFMTCRDQMYKCGSLSSSTPSPNAPPTFESEKPEPEPKKTSAKTIPMCSQRHPPGTDSARRLRRPRALRLDERQDHETR
jgi:ubiquinone/menaquinone biosynthesis C-methylase UbiE